MNRKSLKEIGLDSYSGMEATTKPGQIKIVDTNKLKAALETRGDQVMQLFSATPDAKMIDKEERYYKKFAQLEKAMNALNSQSNWLTSQLGSGK